MEFTKNTFSFDEMDLNDFFHSESGQGSRITEKDEAKKRQLTITKDERELLVRYHNQIPKGKLSAAEARGEQVYFKFRKYPTGQQIELKLNFPKPKKNELRLYFNEALFSPEAGDFWFIFEREGQLWIGSLSDEELIAAQQRRPIDPQNGFDQASEESYQEALNKNAPDLVLSSSLKYKRDPKVAISALTRSGYVCEMLPNHKTFPSKTTGKPYLEAHHFVPMMEQRHFDKSLDVEQNVCILNPFAHKMLHHAVYEEIEPYLKALAEPREDFLRDLGVSVDWVLQSYGKP